jgi:hypothetical protein
MLYDGDDVIDNEHIEEANHVHIVVVVDRVGFKEVENALVNL